MADLTAAAAQPGARDAIAEAHERLLGESGLQFDLPPVAPDAPPPGWLLWLGRLLDALGPFLEVLFWAFLVCLVGALAYFFLRGAVHARWPARKTQDAAPASPQWKPVQARARALLADADRLAAEGRFEEAVHLLLFRSIDDIDAWRPQLVKPAFTSRDIARLNALPSDARDAFVRIAQAVERSFFGAARIDAAEFAECRRTYAAFALPAGS
jgi:hypothetical protein